MDPTASGLDARGVTVALSGRPVLENVDLAISPGRVTALVAPSGRGKSTLLRALVRLVEFDAGTIVLDGADVRAIDPVILRRRVGFVAQAPAMLPGTVGDNLRYGLEELSAAGLDAALEAAAVPRELAGQDARELSVGQGARVALARALTRTPEILLLDEPTAALDRVTAEKVGESLRTLCEEGVGICLATHDSSFAGTYADRQVVLG